eukprot:TRINITY_DN4799_c0_g1_i4.p1 TRINITY_DN4799_c0_g1~~TRINITY_DN4799_c0_g1_i4.p1  ORF type:complete len:544 (+),score=52.48 TRINITY_DN4799_c0_g1_i4:504-2135(+)
MAAPTRSYVARDGTHCLSSEALTGVRLLPENRSSSNLKIGLLCAKLADGVRVEEPTWSTDAYFPTSSHTSLERVHGLCDPSHLAVGARLNTTQVAAIPAQGRFVLSILCAGFTLESLASPSWNSSKVSAHKEHLRRLMHSQQLSAPWFGRRDALPPAEKGPPFPLAEVLVAGGGALAFIIGCVVVVMVCKLEKQKKAHTHAHSVALEEPLIIHAETDATSNCGSGTAGSSASSTASPPGLKLTSLQGRKYCLLQGDVLGRGAFGVVYRGVDLATEQFVALKELAPAQSTDDESVRLRNELTREVNFLRRLAHPNVVKYFGTIVGERVFIVMELLECGNLRQVLDSEPCGLGVSQVVKHLMQILEGLRYLHLHGIVHRDIKPGNVLLDGNRQAKLADFGLAVQRATTGGISHVLPCESPPSTTLGLCGTPRYLSPESVRTGKVDRPSDVWSVGVMGVELLTGLPPWSHVLELDWKASPMAILFHIGRLRSGGAPYPVPEWLSPKLKNVLQSALEPDPKRRATAARLLALLSLVECCDISDDVSA